MSAGATALGVLTVGGVLTREARRQGSPSSWWPMAAWCSRRLVAPGSHSRCRRGWTPRLGNERRDEAERTEQRPHAPRL